MQLRSGNPVLRPDTFVRAVMHGPDHMTLQGAVAKTALLVAITIASAVGTWMVVGAGPLSLIVSGGAAIAGLIMAMIIWWKPVWAPVTTPIYAVLEGAMLAAISGYAEMSYPGIVVNAVGLTLGTLVALLGAYASGLIRATENLKLGLFAATGGIALVYLVSFLLSLFTGRPIPYIHGTGWIGIGFSLFVVGIAALNLVLDFDFIEQGAERRSPKYMEWYAAFGLLVTLVWLYIEILHLLMKLQGRQRSSS